jgi:hypothetical protein
MFADLTPPWHLMVDIETLSTKPNAAILSIGAVGFHPTTVIESPPWFYIEVDPESMGSEFNREPATLDWWAKQAHQPTGSTPIQEALNNFLNFLSSKKWCAIWANSPSFDLVILKSAFELCGLVWPLPYYIEHDVRTVNNLLLTKQQKIKPTHHAIHDCQGQILRVQQGYSLLAALEK